MESNAGRESAGEQLREIERGELASWIVYPPTPVWWPIGFGLWSAAVALVIGLLEGTAESVAQLSLVGILLLAITWDRRRRGTYPTGRPPRAFTPAVATLMIGAAIVAGVAWLVGEQVSVWAAAAIAGVGAWAVVAWYERQYAVVAARLRERLG